jgi:hypothetical protein
MGAGAGSVVVENTIFSDAELAPVVNKNGGVVKVSYSLSNTTELPGQGNINEDPEVLDPDYFNFELSAKSPCINRGNPSVLDKDGSRVDMGAEFISHQNKAIENVIINEFYRNVSNVDPEDWIEVYNRGDVEVDLSGWHVLDRDNDFFIIPENTIINANEYLVICKDTSNFKQFYDPDIKIVGNFEFNLGNSRDDIRIYDSEYFPMDIITYDEDKKWPDSEDKETFSVALTKPSLNNDVAKNWNTAYNIYGTPGAANVIKRFLWFTRLPKDYKTEEEFIHQ